MLSVCVNTYAGRAAYHILYDRCNTLLIILMRPMKTDKRGCCHMLHLLIKPVILKFKQHKDCNLRMNMLWIIGDKCVYFRTRAG